MNPIPTKEAIRRWIAENPGLAAKRDIAKAFGIKGDARIDLKRLLRELEAEGVVEKTARRFHEAGTLPPVAVLRVLAPDAAGDLYAEALEEGAEAGLRILIIPKAGDPALGEGDRILARLAKVDLDDCAYEARLIRRIGSNPLKLLGVFRANAEGGRIVPIDKGQDKEWRVARDKAMGARDGELVEAQAVGNRKLGLPQAEVVARLGDPSGPRAVSLIAIHQHGIPDQFPDAVMAEAEAALPVGTVGREDLRGMALVTIDPVDARDRDDAVYAEADADAASDEPAEKEGSERGPSRRRDRWGRNRNGRNKNGRNAPEAESNGHAASPVEAREPQPERQAAPNNAIEEIVAQPVEPRKWQPPAATVTATEAAKPKAGWWSKRG